MPLSPVEEYDTTRRHQETVRQALNSDNPDQRRIAEAGLEFTALLLKKNADYGSSVWKPPLLKPTLDNGDAILVRMSDKVSRIAQLASNHAQVAESLEDTIRDLGAYCLLWLCRPKPTGVLLDGTSEIPTGTVVYSSELKR